MVLENWENITHIYKKYLFFKHFCLFFVMNYIHDMVFYD